LNLFRLGLAYEGLQKDGLLGNSFDLELGQNQFRLRPWLRLRLGFRLRLRLRLRANAKVGMNWDSDWGEDVGTWPARKAAIARSRAEAASSLAVIG